MLKLKLQYLWSPDAESWLIGKDSDAGKDWGLEEKGMTEDEMVVWHHWHSGHGFGWTLVVGNGQGALVCCNSWGCKESDMTEQLNWIETPKLSEQICTHIKSTHLSLQSFVKQTNRNIGKMGKDQIINQHTYFGNPTCLNYSRHPGANSHVKSGSCLYRGYNSVLKTEWLRVQWNEKYKNMVWNWCMCVCV